MGALVSGIGSYEAGNTNAGIAKTNAQFASMNASDALARGNIKAAQIEGQGSQVVGKEKAGYSASGVDTSAGGTPMQAMADSRMMSQLDSQTALNNAAREAWGYKTQAYGYTQQAGLDYNNALFSLAGGIVSTEGQIAQAAGS